MDIIEKFVIELRALAPSFRDLKAKGLDDSFVQDFISSYDCKIVPEKNCSHAFDPMTFLQCKYDCSKVQIGLVQFNEEIVEHQDFYLVGIVEQDNLIMDRKSGGISVVDFLSQRGLPSLHLNHEESLWRPRCIHVTVAPCDV